MEFSKIVNDYNTTHSIISNSIYKWFRIAETINLWAIWDPAYIYQPHYSTSAIHTQMMMYKPSSLTISCLNYRFVLILIYIRLRCATPPPHPMKLDRNKPVTTQENNRNMIKKRNIKHVNEWTITTTAAPAAATFSEWNRQLFQAVN